MILSQLLQRIERLEPEASASHQARMLLWLVLNQEGRLESYEDEAGLSQQLRSIQMQWQAARDQESAVAAELDELASTQPAEFHPSHVWTLIRAIKVQKHMLDFYQRSRDEATADPGSGARCLS